MKYLLCFVSCCSIFCALWQPLYAQQNNASLGDLSFFRIAEGKGDAGLLDLHEDPQGNLLAVGFFAESLIFGTQRFTCNAPRSVKYFYAKFNPEGQLLWLREHPTVVEGLRITAEKVECDAQGNIYVFGVYRGSARFGSGQGQTLQNTSKNSTEYLAKYDGRGNLLWVRGFNDGFYDGERDFITDAQGNSYLLGYPAALRKISSEGTELYYTRFPTGFTAGSLCLWQNKVFVGASLRGDNDFSVSFESQESLRLPGIKAASGFFYNQDAFLARLDANSGKIEWMQFIRSNTTDEIEGIAVDNEGNVSITGICAANATLGLATGTSFLPASERNRANGVPFVAGFTAEGRLRWVRGLDAEDKSRDAGHYAVSLSVNKNTGELLGTRAHCNEGLWWAVYIEGFDKNGKSTFYKTLGLGNNTRNTGFWKSSCGVANVFVHRSNYKNNVYIYGEGRYIDGKDFTEASGSNFASLSHSGNNTRFFIAGYRTTGTPSPQPPIVTEPPIGANTNNNNMVWVYDQAAFQGRMQQLSPGTYNMQQLSIGNDAISSVKVPQGMRVILFEHANFEGARLTLTQDSRALGDFNKLTSSMIVERMNNNNNTNNNTNTNTNTNNSSNTNNTNNMGSTAASVSFKGCATGQEQVGAENSQFEQEVLRLVNVERQKQGLTALRWNGDLARAARYHAADMHVDKYFEHDSFDRENGKLVQVCRTFERIGKFGRGFAENIAINPGKPEEVMRSWMNSPGHRNNILGKHQSLGVGFYKGYWVQVFGQ